MGWADLLAQTETITVPWVGGNTIAHKGRWWTVQGRFPREHGWHQFEVSGTKVATWKGKADPDLSYEEGRKMLKGYLVGDWLIPDNIGAIQEYDKIPHGAVQVHLLDEGLDRFCRVITVLTDAGFHIFLRPDFPLGPEADVQAAYLDHKPSVTSIPQVTPALDLSFRWETQRREQAEKRRQELERLAREEAERLAREERHRQIMEQVGTGAGRRQLAAVDFEAAARASLALSGAQLLDCRRSYNRGEWVVQYRFQGRSLECTCDQNLRIIDSGICLTDHNSGEKGDTYFTLESLPTVVAEAMRGHKLVVYRHGADDDVEDPSGEW